MGGFGYGGMYFGTWSQGGGGAGWFGGGAGSYAGSAGGGGSSYISGHAGCIGVDSSGKSKVSEYSEISDSVSYTGYKFINTQMIDGSGYIWTAEKSTYVKMPTRDGADLMVGNTGNGYAKITYLGN